MTAQELSDRLWQFAARIAKVVDALPDTRVGRHVATRVSGRACTTLAMQAANCHKRSESS